MQACPRRPRVGQGFRPAGVCFGFQESQFCTEARGVAEKVSRKAEVIPRMRENGKPEH